MLETASHENPLYPDIDFRILIKYSYIDHMYLYDKATCIFIIHYNQKIPTKFIFYFLKLKLKVQLINTGFKTQLTYLLLIN